MGRYGGGHEGTGGHPCGGCKVEKERAEHIENCVEFGMVLGMNVQDWWMGLRGLIDDRLLEKIKRIDGGRGYSGRLKKRESRTTRNIRVTVKNKYFIHLFIRLCC